MDSGADIPVCPPPWEEPSDVVPMVVVLGCFLAVGWLVRRWIRTRRKNRSGR